MKTFNIILMLALLTNGCTLLKASPRTSSSFLPSENGAITIENRAPFHGLWTNDLTNYQSLHKNYAKLHILNVSTEPAEEIIKTAKLMNNSLKQRRIQEIREVSRYFNTKLNIALKDYPQPIMELTDEPDDKTIVLQLALVEVIPTNGAVNLASNIAGFFVSGSSLAKLAAQGGIAIEGIARDGKSAKILYFFKDYETDKLAPFSVKDYQQYAHIRESIDDWSKQLAILLNTASDYKVEDALPINIIPY